MVVNFPKTAWPIPTFDDLVVRNPHSKLWEIAYRPDGIRHIYIPKTLRKELIPDAYYNFFKRMLGLNPLAVPDFERYIEHYIHANGEAKLPLAAINSGKQMISSEDQFHKKRKKMIRLIERMLGAKTQYEYTRKGYDCFSLSRELYPFEDYPLSNQAFSALIAGLAERVHETHMNIKTSKINEKYIIELASSDKEKPYIDSR